MVAMDQDGTATWYEAYVSGEEGDQRMLQRLAVENERMEDDGGEEEEVYEEEVEIEEMVDDEPMHVTGRLFLGSIDAARNVSSKTITMRLLSDISDDYNSDLRDIFTYSLVAATTSSQGDRDSPRSRFAYLRIDQIKTKELCAIDVATLHKSGFNSIEEVLTVLQQFYPDVTMTTPLLMLHFRCLSASISACTKM
ncbi:hypothetical protein BBO99_00006123 [Phytophthora kernoviae]|uniref:Uncharacterized protein n=2 Tax=Phytophthora kernoviae TaxID=325452 RepID=A0A421GLQ5_9STRA|nr:hypothetical protein G195_007351 [Phytophthora kernoviae 00238/432]KAG2526989.1 hypothetical protein JM16_002375 [Phytophthora kernoviae]KAG2528504.1 hypothetical protein JM18_003057 [Phytophthora kernoviae]RLN14163.1 hypothetical protein BBI17_006258 [Phytophthora kernoviae]RLN78207.1 hypothetical protein BBO99_00006123 [Phytophthora kernoviae]